VSDEDIDKMTHVNAMRDYHFDPFAHRTREQCTVGALRAESPDVDLSLKSHGGKPPSEDEGSWITSHDITTQLASAFMPEPE